MQAIAITNQSDRLLVIQLLDAYTSAPAHDPDLAVTVVGLLQKPLRKSDGMYVFQRVPAGTYTVTVGAGLYHAETLQVDTSQLHPLDPFVRVALNPSPAYAFGEGATLVRANVRDAQQLPLADLTIRAVVTSDACAKARLAQETDQAGSRELALTRIAGRFTAGERYWLQDPEGKSGERCVIAAADLAARTVTLAAPLLGQYPRGALLLPYVETRSDHRGEVVLGFGNTRTKKFDVRIEFQRDEQTLTVKEVSLEEGQMLGLGAIPIKVVG